MDWYIYVGIAVVVALATFMSLALGGTEDTGELEDEDNEVL